MQLRRAMNSKTAKRIRRLARKHGGDPKQATRIFSRQLSADEQDVVLHHLHTLNAPEDNNT